MSHLWRGALALRVKVNASFVPLCEIRGNSGIDFKVHIADYIGNSCVVLILIGEAWRNKRWWYQRLGFRARATTEDFVQTEIELALEMGVPVLPVLVDGASMPTARFLPLSVVEIGDVNAAAVRSGRDFHAEMNGVMARIKPLHYQGAKDNPMRSRLPRPTPSIVAPSSNAEEGFKWTPAKR